MIRSKPEPESRPDAAWNDLLQAIRATGARVVNLEAVRGYVGRFPDVLPLASDLLRAAHGEFGPQAELALELYRDPEIDDEYLSLLIRVPRYERDFIERINSITDAHDDQLAKISGFVSVSTDYRQPSANGTI